MVAFAGASWLHAAGSARSSRQMATGLISTGVIILIAVLGLHVYSEPSSNWTTLAPHALAAMIGAGALATDRLLGARLGAAMLTPLAMLVLLVRFFIEPGPRPIATSSLVSSWMTSFHVAMALAGQVMAIAACVLSILYLWQYRALKSRRFEAIGNDGPALERLDQWLQTTLISGFVMLSLSLMTGALFFAPLFSPGGAPHGISLGSASGDNAALIATKAKILWAIAVWSWYLATLVARNILRAPVRIIAKMSVAGFALIALAWFGLLFFAVQSPMIRG